MPLHRIRLAVDLLGAEDRTLFELHQYGSGDLRELEDGRTGKRRHRQQLDANSDVFTHQHRPRLGNART